MSELSRCGRGIAKILTELGLVTMWQSTRDVKLLCAQRFVRLFAYGGSTLILASYLNALDISEDRIGLFMTLTLIGDVGISFILTLFADAMGRRAVLSLGSLLMVASGVVFAAIGNYWALLAAAVFGVISPSGNEIGPFRAVEESTLAHLTPHEHLRDVFAWYSLIGTAGAALGNLVCGWIMTSLKTIHHWEFIPTCRFIFLIYASIGVVKFVLTVCLSRKVELAQKTKEQNAQAQGGQGQNPENSETRPLLADQNGSEQPAQPPRKNGFFEVLEKDLWSLVIRLSILFGLDSFASGLASPAWMIYFFKRKFSLSEGQLGSVFSTTSVISAFSMLAASSIAKRIGNIKTMVFTHFPSAVCLSLISVMPTLPGALTFLVLRACSQTMDVAPRSAFLAAALPADKRTAIMGGVNVVKTSSQSMGPLITGVLARHKLFGVSFIIAGILKVIYDLGMLFSFAGKDAEKRKQQAEQDEEQ